QGKRTPFRMTNPMKAFEEVWAHVAATHDLPMYVAGKSYGGRVGSMMLDRLPICRGLIFFGYPFHPPGKPEKLRTEHLYDITLPMLFLQGERDEFATADLVHDFVGNHEYARLIWLEDGDHSWKARKKSGFSQADHIRRAAVEVQTFCANHG
ncbi:MAG: alpha/beta hydrolase family protein, partial [Candidatus Kariarchaeaceae archaeon]